MTRPSRSERLTGSSNGSRVTSFSMLNTSRRRLPLASRDSQPVSVSATALRYSIQPLASVVMTASPMDYSVTCAFSFSSNTAVSARLRSLMSEIVPS